MTALSLPNLSPTFSHHHTPDTARAPPRAFPKSAFNGTTAPSWNCIPTVRTALPKTAWGQRNPRGGIGRGHLRVIRATGVPGVTKMEAQPWNAPFSQRGSQITEAAQKHWETAVGGHRHLTPGVPVLCHSCASPVPPARSQSCPLGMHPPGAAPGSGSCRNPRERPGIAGKASL